MSSTPLLFACKLMAYTACSATLIGSLWYDELYVHDPLVKNKYAGKWKFLTHWTVYIQVIYWTLSVLAGLVHRSYDERNGFIHRLVDYIHASIAFPMGMLVCLLFWSIYAVDRELVHPKRFDEILPYWLNHVLHTSYIPFLLMDKGLVSHRYPKSSHGLLLLLVVPTIYQLWILYLGIWKDIWVYPVLEVLNWPSRVVFFLLTWVFLALLYNAGSYITNQIWGGQPVAHEEKVR